MLLSLGSFKVCFLFFCIAVESINSKQLKPFSLQSMTCSSWDKSTCEDCVVDGRNWCPLDQTCHSRGNMFSTCGVAASVGGGAWIKESLGCKKFEPLKGEWSGEGLKISGCTDPNGSNYRFQATIDDGSCIFGEGLTPSNSEQQRCICSDAGGDSYLKVLDTPYGRFCGTGYTGGNGQQPCDQLDKCCQIDDWCVAQKGKLNCDCMNQFLECVRAVPETPGFCGHLSLAKHSLEKGLAKSLSLPLALHCGGSSITSPAVCNAAVNCGNGTCGYTGGCSCNRGFEGYECRNCAAFFYPPHVCNLLCSDSDTCGGWGKCRVDGSCSCRFLRFGNGCQHDSAPMLLVFLSLIICILVVYFCSRHKRQQNITITNNVGYQDINYDSDITASNANNNGRRIPVVRSQHSRNANGVISGLEMSTLPDLISAQILAQNNNSGREDYYVSDDDNTDDLLLGNTDDFDLEDVLFEDNSTVYLESLTDPVSCSSVKTLPEMSLASQLVGHALSETDEVVSATNHQIFDSAQSAEQLEIQSLSSQKLNSEGTLPLSSSSNVFKSDVNGNEN